MNVPAGCIEEDQLIVPLPICRANVSARLILIVRGRTTCNYRSSDLLAGCAGFASRRWLGSFVQTTRKPTR